MQKSSSACLTIGGRTLLAAIFLISPLVNLIPNYSDVATSMGDHGVPAPQLSLVVAILLLLLGSMSLIVGYKARYGAVLLILFLIPATLYFHAPWTAADAADASEQAIHFLKNLGLAGALLFVLAVGPGPASFDEGMP